MLRQFWDCYLNAKASGSKMVGYNLFGYDLLFIIRRSWIMGVRVPHDAIMFGSGPYRNDTIIDLMAVWMCGMYDGFASLDSLAEYFGAGERGGSVPFHTLWRANQREAIDYHTYKGQIENKNHPPAPTATTNLAQFRGVLRFVRRFAGRFDAC